MCGDPLSEVPDGSELICLFNQIKPAHTTILWQYVGPAFSAAFSNAFDSLFSSSGQQQLTGAFNGYQFSSAFDRRMGGAFESRAFSTAFDKPK
jgi:hypothetical protein